MDELEQKAVTAGRNTAATLILAGATPMRVQEAVGNGDALAQLCADAGLSHDDVEWLAKRWPIARFGRELGGGNGQK